MPKQWEEILAPRKYDRETGEPLPFTQGNRSSGDLTHPVADEARQGDSESVGDFEAGEGVSTVREDAEGSLHFLNFTSQKPAVLLARAWHVEGIPFAFQHIDVYREVAADAKCSLVEIARPEAGGLEHFVFAARTLGLTEQQYLACIEDEPRPRSGDLS